MLSCIDLNFKLQQGFRFALGRELEDQMRGMPKVRHAHRLTLNGAHGAPY